MLRVLDLFAGIGAFSYGLERTGGFRTVAFCETDRYCRRLLLRHWSAPCYGDVRQLNEVRLKAAGISVDVICAGFPCQDISLLGTGAGISGARSGLWSECTRLIGELQPRYVVVENVAALRGRGLDRVLGDLAALGFDAEWHTISAAAVGAPHRRDRLWLLCYRPEIAPDANCVTAERLAVARRECRHWRAEPRVGRVANGVPARMDRLRALGNSAVPQIIEIFGQAMLELEYLRLPGLQLIAVEETDRERVVHVRRRRSLTRCPACAASALVANGARRVSIRDVPAGRPVRLAFDRQRFLCRRCGTTCYDDADEFDGRRRMTARLISFIAEAVRERSCAAVARAVGVDEKTVRLVAREAAWSAGVGA
jgi:DNA (cytosine-5)-methyltransferase 1